MGREVRRVPPHWDHPKTKLYHNGYGYQPMFDETFAAAAARWKKDFAEWESGGNKDHPDMQFWEWDGGPPDREYYRPWADDDATWFQLWETVSEGTPVSPPFATKAELIDYLAEQGDFWDQKRGDGAWSRQAAERMIGAGWAPSLIVIGSSIIAPRDGGSP